MTGRELLLLDHAQRVADEAMILAWYSNRIANRSEDLQGFLKVCVADLIFELSEFHKFSRGYYGGQEGNQRENVGKLTDQAESEKSAIIEAGENPFS